MQYTHNQPKRSNPPSKGLRDLAAWLTMLSVTLLLLALVTRGPQWAARAAGLPAGTGRLWNALALDDPKELRRALAEGADVERVNEYAQTPLVLAAGVGDSELVRLLLNAGARPDHPNELGITPLVSAVMGERVMNVRLLLAAGADPQPTNPRKFSPLILAIRAENDELIGLLLAAGADPNAPDFEGITPMEALMSAGRNKSVSN